jgi:hypothetical protein
MTVEALDNLNAASLTRREVIAQREAQAANGESPAVKRLKAEEQ